MSWTRQTTEKTSDSPSRRLSESLGGQAATPSRSDPSPPPNVNIGPSIQIKGTVTGSEDLVIDGTVEGKICLDQYALTIELPNGMIPVDGQLVPANGDGATGVLDERSLLQWTWPAVVGGRFIISIAETGTALFTWLAQLK